MMIEQHIEELRAELRNAIDLEERQQIVAELAAAVAELDAMLENMVPDWGQTFGVGAIPPPDRPAPVSSAALNTHSPSDSNRAPLSRPQSSSDRSRMRPAEAALSVHSRARC